MEPFIYLPPFPFVFCSHCKLGFVKSEVYNHLKVKHGHLSRSQIKSIRNEVAAVPGMANDQHGLKNWEPPPPTIQPIPYIQPPQDDRLGCNLCPYVVGEVRRMQEHCRK
jgi:hypothetical protein